MIDYPDNYSNFELKLKNKTFHENKDIMVVFYKRDFGEQGSAICEIVKKEDGFFYVECGINSPYSKVIYKDHVKEKKDSEEEAKKLMFKWINDRRISMIFSTEKKDD